MARVVRAVLVVAALMSGLYYWLTRLRPLSGIAAPNPAASYVEAIRRLELLQAAEVAKVNPVCRTTLLTHGKTTPRAIVFLHGFTNCPHQFHQLAEQFFDLGYNVLNLRLPRHGMADLLTDELAYLTSEALGQQTNAALDIARGLADHVTVMGLSLGGTLAGWAAQHRRDLDRAVLISPALAIRAIPRQRQRLYANLLSRLPNSFRWWDPANKAERVVLQHAYPRFATRGLGALLRLGGIVEEEAQQARPACPRVIVILNPADDIVDNTAALAAVAGWRSHGGHITTHTFAGDLALIHDLIDPAQPGQQITVVYPQLFAWLDG